MAEPQNVSEADVMVNAPQVPLASQEREYLAKHQDKPIKTIVLLVAMEAEAAPLIAHLGLTLQKDAIPPPAPCVVYSGAQDGAQVHVVVNGKCSTHGVDNVGTVPAAVTAYLALQTFRPDLIVSAGTAGGFGSQGARIGDIFVSTATINHDRRIPLGPFEAYGIGRNAAVPTPNLQKAIGLKSGVVSSGNSLDHMPRDLEIMRQHDTAIKEMEAAAVAWAAGLFNTPMFCVKAVTDIVDGDRPTQEEFLENLGAAGKALQETLPRVIAFVAGKWYHEL